MKETKEALNEALTNLAVLRENKGDLGEEARFPSYRYYEGQKFGLQLGIYEFKEYKKWIAKIIEERLSIAYKTRNHYMKDNIKSEKWESIIIILEGLYKEITDKDYKFAVYTEGVKDE